MADVNRYRPYVGPGSPRPPHQPDPPENEAPLGSQTLGVEREMGGIEGPAETRDGLYGGSAPGQDERDGQERGNSPEWAGRQEEPEEEEPEVDWLNRAKSAFRSSTDWFDTTFRSPLEDSLRAFNSQHPMGSKYNSDAFKKRSNLYRPKTRTVMRKNEAALCAALFSNLDLIETAAANSSDQAQVVSAEVMKALLQERLSVTMPWFQFSIGGLQDAMAQGIVIAHSYWQYTEVTGADGKYRVKQDRPVQELIPMENFRFDPSAKWWDVVGTSPYLIELIPMYVGDVKERMRHPDPKGNKWMSLSDEVIHGCIERADQSTRQARTNQAQDAAEHNRDIDDYEIVWVHRHIHRHRGEDFEFYMLGSRFMLTEPEPLETNVWFGERPYVIGSCILETHRPAPSSVPTLSRALQDEANDLDNQTSDNLKFILNKAWFVKRGANVDTTSLVRNVPGRVTMVNDAEKDVKEVTWPDLPQSTFEQKNRNDADFDQLLGNFNPMTLGQSRSPRESYRTLSAVQSPAMMVTEYTLMTYVQTFLLPCLRQLVLLEQYYETDETIMAAAGEKAKLMQRFGINEVTDTILEKKMAVNVNIGMGATDPTMKQERFSGALNTYAGICKQPPPGLDLKEVGKELFALAGYRDGMRFFGDQDPEKVKLMQTIQQLGQKLKAQEIEKRNKHESNVVKLVTAREGNLVKLMTAAKEDDHQSRHLLVGHLLEMEKADRTAEQQRTLQSEGAVQQANAAAAKPQPAGPKVA